MYYIFFPFQYYVAQRINYVGESHQLDLFSPIYINLCMNFYISSYNVSLNVYIYKCVYTYIYIY
jgi:hypothetical protein